jgi:large subunit ribosomal protein L3
MLEGAVPGHKGGWITVRDAVKKVPPKDLPKPGKFKAPAAAETPAKAEAAQAAAPQAEAAPQEGA